LLRTVACHEADDERADYRSRNNPGPEMVLRQRDQFRREALEKDKIRNDRDQPKEGLGHDRADRADRDGEGNEKEHPAIGPEVTEWGVEFRHGTPNNTQTYQSRQQTSQG